MASGIKSRRRAQGVTKGTIRLSGHVRIGTGIDSPSDFRSVKRLSVNEEGGEPMDLISSGTDKGG